MGTRPMIRVLLVALLTAVAAPMPAQAQLGSLIKRTVKSEIDRKVADWVRDAVRCALGDQDCVEQAQSRGEKVVIVDDDGEPIMDSNGDPVVNQDEAAAQTQAPGTGVWTNYDFVPGRDVWFALDLTDDRVGRFPNDLEYVNGNGQIVEVNGARAIQFTDNTTFYVNLPENLPETFTLEYAAQTAAPNIHISTFFNPLTELGISERTYDSHYIRVWRGGGLYFQAAGVSQTDSHWEVATEFVPIRFQADGNYAVMYMGSDRVANVPNATFNRTSNRIEFQVNANGDRPAFLKDIVVAVGIDDLADALRTDGSYTTRGILFGVDSDVLRPESTPVLEELRRTLENNPEFSKVVIEGHTDDTGDDDHNEDLSERRAEAVKDYLESQGIDGGRIDTEGMGESAPVADNTTASGRQQNRRVVVRVR